MAVSCRLPGVGTGNGTGSVCAFGAGPAVIREGRGVRFRLSRSSLCVDKGDKPFESRKNR